MIGMQHTLEPSSQLPTHQGINTLPDQADLRPVADLEVGILLGGHAGVELLDPPLLSLLQPLALQGLSRKLLLPLLLFVGLLQEQTAKPRFIDAGPCMPSSPAPDLTC